jgi:hypothetical protein
MWVSEWVCVCVCVFVTVTDFSTYKPVTTTTTVIIMPDMPLRTWTETNSVWKSVELQTVPINEGRLFPHLTQNNYCVFYIIRLDDHHVERVRLRLWTAVTIGLLIIPQVIYEHGEPWWNDMDRGKLLIRLPEFSGIPISRVIWFHARGNGRNEWEIDLAKCLF